MSSGPQFVIVSIKRGFFEIRVRSNTCTVSRLGIYVDCFVLQNRLLVGAGRVRLERFDLTVGIFAVFAGVGCDMVLAGVKVGRHVARDFAGRGV